MGDDRLEMRPAVHVGLLVVLQILFAIHGTVGTSQDDVHVILL